MNVSITPIIPSKERNPEERSIPQNKPIDSKVKGFVLERITHARGGLLPSASAPQIVIDLLPAVEAGKREYAPRQKRKPKLRKMPLVKGIPIGLLPSDSQGGINAFMQFVLFVPGFAELFFFAPRSFQLFQEFIDQYRSDQEEKKAVSSASGSPLIRFLRNKLPEFGLYEVFQFLVRELHSQWEIHPNLEEGVQRGVSDLFVRESSYKKQFFMQADWVCYELDAFVERRPDGGAAHFVTYVKSDGGWYQCDNERITLLRSNCLRVPLERSMLLHYKRIALR